jgi:hypothetical protein
MLHSGSDISMVVISDGFVKSPKIVDLSLRAKRGNLRTARIAKRYGALRLAMTGWDFLRDRYL